MGAHVSIKQLLTQIEHVQFFKRWYRITGQQPSLSAFQTSFFSTLGLFVESLPSGKVPQDKPFESGCILSNVCFPVEIRITKNLLSSFRRISLNNFSSIQATFYSLEKILGGHPLSRRDKRQGRKVHGTPRPLMCHHCCPRDRAVSHPGSTMLSTEIRLDQSGD